MLGNEYTLDRLKTQILGTWGVDADGLWDLLLHTLSADGKYNKLPVIQC